MDKPTEIIDRDAEWADLVRIWERPRADLVFVLGRRRAGKSYLLRRFAHGTGGIYYQATQRTEQEQLSRLSDVVGHHFQDAALASGVSFPDWEALLAYIAHQAGGDRLLVVLDEFPYLSNSAPALPSILQGAWDQRRQDTRVKLVLCGSHITAMRRLEEADQPLYGRRTARLDIQPFDYRDAAAFLPEYGPVDALRAYGIFGGLPGHLDLLDPDSSIERNVEEHLLSPSGRLLDEAQHMLDAFLPDAEVHYSIIEAVAGGERTWQGIRRRVGRDGGSLSRAVRWLMDMGLLERVVPVSEPRPEKSKRTLYRIRDPYLAFWHRFISPMVSAGMIGLSPGERLWRSRIVPRLDEYMGAVFEQACRRFVETTDRLPFEPLRVGSWWDHEARNEVDVVALGPDEELLVGECKWGTATGADLRKLRKRAELIANELKGSREPFLVVFAGDLAPDLQREVDEGNVLHYRPEDLYHVGDGSGGSP